MKHGWIAAGVLLALGACTPTPDIGQTPPATPAPDHQHTPAPAPVADQCGAAEAQRYVGRPRTEIPVPVLPNLQRVACTTCPVTMDFSPRRLNFLFDADTGVIKEVKCG